MRRSPFVIAGTVAGVAGVLAFPTHRTRLVLPGSRLATGAPTTSGGAAATTPATSPSTSASAPPTSAASPATTAGPPTTAGGSTATTSGGTTATTAPPATSPPATAPPTTASAVRHASGQPQQYPYGVLSVTVTVKGKTITDIAIASISETDGRSVQIDQIAIPMLRQQVLAAQSTNINGVSGATYTSQAYVDSVQSALDSIGFK